MKHSRLKAPCGIEIYRVDREPFTYFGNYRFISRQFKVYRVVMSREIKFHFRSQGFLTFLGFAPLMPCFRRGWTPPSFLSDVNRAK